VTRRERQRRRARRHRSPLRRAIVVIGTIALLAAVAAGIAAAGWVVDVVNDTPDIDQLRPKPLGTVSTVYAADGTRLGFIYGDDVRRPVAADEIPLAMKQATVAIEDRRFYRHGGVDVVGVVRAAIKNVTSDRTSQGGSTLTMQLVRNLYIPEKRFDKTLTRKVWEAKLAEELEQRHSKAWILLSYLNNVPYGTDDQGKTAIGVQAAARMFFDKPAAELTLPQAALLAGLPQAPTQYNPFLNPSGAKQRRGEVLDAMAQAGYISQAAADAADAAPLGVRRGRFYSERRERFFFDYVEQELRHRYGDDVINRGGLKVFTTIDLHFQELAREAIAYELSFYPGPSAALATVDPANGHILAMASSATYGETVFNYATQAHRQPGSTFKVIDLMAAVREGIDPATTYYNSHHLTPGWLPEAPTWEVQTDDHSYRGNVSLASALPPSDNTVFAQLGADIGPEKIRQAAYDMGITSHLDAYYAEAIGGLTTGVSPLEMANAYATVADGGWRNRATGIARVVHPDGKIDQLGKPHRKKEFTDGETAAVLAPMKQVLINGTAGGLGIGCPAAGKTGTTSSHTDVWFVGVTPKLSTAVWVGYPDDTRTLGEIFGATIPAPIWQRFMLAAKGDYCEDWPAPKEPFEGTAYTGTYAGKAGPPPTDETIDEDGDGVPDEGTGPGDDKPDQGGGGYDPDKYAHRPQDTPTTKPPPPPPATDEPGEGGGAAAPTD
jgi:penicillin-binding protein 1A